MQAFWQDVSKVFDLVDPLLGHSAKKRIMMQRTTHLKLPDTVFLRPILLTQTGNDATKQELSAPGQLIWVLLVWFASCSEIKHFQMQPLVFLRVRTKDLSPWARDMALWALCSTPAWHLCASLIHYKTLTICGKWTHRWRRKEELGRGTFLQPKRICFVDRRWMTKGELGWSGKKAYKEVRQSWCLMGGCQTWRHRSKPPVSSFSLQQGCASWIL